jgi:hypothetical protein
MKQRVRLIQPPPRQLQKHEQQQQLPTSHGGFFRGRKCRVSLICCLVSIQLLGLIPLILLGGPYVYDAFRHLAGKDSKDDFVALSSIQKVYHRPKSRPTAAAHLKLPRPILVVGMPKAGTSSLFGFFHCAGLYSQHWYCCEEQKDPQKARSKQTMADCITYNMVQNLPLLDGCGDYDVITEMNGPRRIRRRGTIVQSLLSSSSSSSAPHVSHGNNASEGTGIPNHPAEEGVFINDSVVPWSHPGARIFLPQRFHLHDFHRDYPNATLILNTRPAHEWAHSVRYAGGMLAKQFANEYLVQGQLLSRFPQGKHAVTEFLIRIMEEHTQYIRDFCRKHPSHACIEVDIRNNQTGDILAHAFFDEESSSSFSFSSAQVPEPQEDGLSVLPSSSSSSSSSSSFLAQLASTCWGHYNQNQQKDRIKKLPRIMVDSIIPNTTHGQERYRKSIERARNRRHDDQFASPTRRN